MQKQFDLLNEICSIFFQHLKSLIHWNMNINLILRRIGLEQN